MLHGSKDVIQQSRHLESVTAEIMGDMNEMSAGAGQIDSAARRISQITNSNKEHIGRLFSEVGKFKVEQ